jgi:hypothetical protein
MKPREGRNVLGRIAAAEDENPQWSTEKPEKMFNIAQS